MINADVFKRIKELDDNYERKSWDVNQEGIANFYMDEGITYTITKDREYNDYCVSVFQENVPESYRELATYDNLYNALDLVDSRESNIDRQLSDLDGKTEKFPHLITWSDLCDLEEVTDKYYQEIRELDNQGFCTVSTQDGNCFRVDVDNYGNYEVNAYTAYDSFLEDPIYIGRFESSYEALYEVENTEDDIFTDKYYKHVEMLEKEEKHRNNHQRYTISEDGQKVKQEQKRKHREIER